jgi:hypothetical protein
MSRPFRFLLLVVLGILSAPSTADATGPVNPGFESGLAGWQATVVPVQSGYYGYDGYVPGNVPQPVPCRVPNGVCDVAVDQFTAGGRAFRVAPREGKRMARLGGPFATAEVPQPLERYRLEQSFVVDPASPVLALNYNAFAYDVSGFDALQIEVRITDGAGRLISETIHGAQGQGVMLRSTGWQGAQVDLSGWENQQVHVRIESGGTGDTLHGFWAYVDAGSVPKTIVGKVNATSAVPLDVQEDAGSGDRWFRAEATALGNGCVPVRVAFAITPALGSTIANVRLGFTPSGQSSVDTPMARNSAGDWTASVACVRNGRLRVEYDVVTGADVQHVLDPLGGLAVQNRYGVVYDKAVYTKLIGKKMAPAAALAGSVVKAATVRLERRVSGEFRPVLAADPGLLPRVNPQITGATGAFGWSAGSGTYRVTARVKGYPDVVSSTFTVPAAPTGLNLGVGIGLTAAKNAAGQPATGPCRNKRGTALRRCRTDTRTATRLARCQSRATSRERTRCVRRVRARR